MKAEAFKQPGKQLCSSLTRPAHLPNPTCCACLHVLPQVPAPTVGAPDHHVADVCIRRRVGAAPPLEVGPPGWVRQEHGCVTDVCAR